MVRKTLKKGLGAQAHAAARPNFLCLPLEARNMVYRHLLVADKILGSVFGTALEMGKGHGWLPSEEYHLQPAILRVCRQTYEEASCVLYGENTFGVQFYGCDHWEDDADPDPEWVYHGSCLFMDFRFGTDKLPPLITKCRKVEVLLDAFTFDLDAVRLDAKNLCSEVLCKMPALHHISIHLLMFGNYKDTHLAIGPFGVLRNVRRVAIRGVPNPFAERLKSLMLGNTPQENVDQMWGSLMNYVKDPAECEFDLTRASRALKEWDYEKFQRIRARIISTYQRRMEDALSQVFDFDPKPEHHQTIIEEDSDSTVEEDPDAEAVDDDEPEF
ncbi:hypothetical protein MMC07_002989 [Pseudocyphellaria aurata]|nr:hypothetical protein [Pseudocyphellaria aurata]